ncbi:hypothetical protein [Streptomyces triculaminicus]|uniref:hypothetical protein n=1 Tax=Streptomyces triculaminicus TaxID=2816232 RepID=UPI0037933443
MSGIWPLATLPGLHIDMGDYTRPWAPGRGSWLRLPTADYRCACGWTASAGGDAVPAFTETAHQDHQPDCPLTRETCTDERLHA